MNASAPQRSSGTLLLLDLSEIVFIFNTTVKQFPVNPLDAFQHAAFGPDDQRRWDPGHTRLSSARLAGKLHVRLTKAVGRDCSSAPSAFTLCCPALSADFAGMNGSAHAHTSKRPVAACPPSCAHQHYLNPTRKRLLSRSAFLESPRLRSQ